MKFVVEKNSEKSWSITPSTGSLAGECVATAEMIEMQDVDLIGQRVIGAIKATWGLTIGDDTYHDLETLRAIGIGKAFKGRSEKPVMLSRDGFCDELTGRDLKKARFLTLSGPAIFRGD